MAAWPRLVMPFIDRSPFCPCTIPKNGRSAVSAAHEPRRQTARRLFHLLGAAREAEAHEPAARFAEGVARRDADIGLVDEAEAELPRVGLAVDREEQVEGALRLGEADAAGGGKAGADDVASGAGALDLEADEVVALVERDGRPRAA